VPVLEIVKQALADHKARTWRRGIHFRSAQTANRSRLENLLRRDMRPALDEAKIEWHGWHAFRRGLPTNLHTLGVKA